MKGYRLIFKRGQLAVEEFGEVGVCVALDEDVTTGAANSYSKKCLEQNVARPHDGHRDEVIAARHLQPSEWAAGSVHGFGRFGQCKVAQSLFGNKSQQPVAMGSIRDHVGARIANHGEQGGEGEGIQHSHQSALLPVVTQIVTIVLNVAFLQLLLHWSLMQCAGCLVRTPHVLAVFGHKREKISSFFSPPDLKLTRAFFFHPVFSMGAGAGKHEAAKPPGRTSVKSFVQFVSDPRAAMTDCRDCYGAVFSTGSSIIQKIVGFVGPEALQQFEENVQYFSICPQLF